MPLKCLKSHIKTCPCVSSSVCITSMSVSSQEEVDVFFFFDEQVRKQQHFEVGAPLAGTSSFLYLTLLFWNQILTCFSDNLRQVAISILLNLDKYMFEANSLSSSRSCVLVKAVLILLEESFPSGGGVGVEFLDEGL